MLGGQMTQRLNAFSGSPPSHSASLRPSHGPRSPRSPKLGFAKPPAPDQASPTDAVKPAGGLAQPPFTVQYEVIGQSGKTAPPRKSRPGGSRLTQSAVQTLSQQQLQFIEGMEKIETVEAFTEKSDGRRIPVDANIITRDGASGLQATYVPDLKVRTMIFPDVSVGDTLVMTNKAETLQNVFPGQFIDSDIFPRSQSLSSVQVTIEAPDTIDLAVGATGNGATDKVELVDGSRLHSISIVPAPYEPEEPGAVSPLDREPALMVSTFHSYAELGKSLRECGVSQDSGDAGDCRFGRRNHQERRWPSGSGGRDRRLGEEEHPLCRDLPVDRPRSCRMRPSAGAPQQVRRLQGQSDVDGGAARRQGIASEAALINLGDAYTLPRPPTLAALNHVILVPEFDLYDDPTANTSAFGAVARRRMTSPWCAFQRRRRSSLAPRR